MERVVARFKTSTASEFYFFMEHCSGGDEDEDASELSRDDVYADRRTRPFVDALLPALETTRVSGLNFSKIVYGEKNAARILKAIAKNRDIRKLNFSSCALSSLMMYLHKSFMECFGPVSGLTTV